MRQAFNRLIHTKEDLDLVKKGIDVGTVQFHLLVNSENPDPLIGQSSQHDRLTAAINELHELDLEVRERAKDIFKKYGFEDHGFAASVSSHYIPEWDKHR